MHERHELSRGWRQLRATTDRPCGSQTFSLSVPSDLEAMLRPMSVANGMGKLGLQESPAGAHDNEVTIMSEHRVTSSTGSNGQYGTDARVSSTSQRGFAAMSREKRREIASKGGHSQGKQNNPGNFANDRRRASEAGRKGGRA